MRQLPILLSATILAACAPDALTPEQQEREDNAAIAAVEAAQDIPPEAITPESMDFADFKEQNLTGVGCAFTPEAGGLGVIFVTLENMGYLKLDGEFQRLAADMGSAQLPMNARAQYDGKRNSVQLAIQEDGAVRSGIETLNYPAFFTVRNARGQSVYSESGTAECGA